MRQKIISLGDDYLADGESRIIPMVHTQYGYEPDDRRRKTAACDDAVEAASKILPEPGMRIILVSAVGDYEHWGDNKKGDAFPYNAIHGKMPGDVPVTFFDPHKQRVPKIWGMECFKTVFDDNGVQIGGGNTFHEHQNRIPHGLLGREYDPKDPTDPRCGYIREFFWNPKMHRVELIQEVWEHKLPDIVRAIDEGFKPEISMACDIPFDRCAYCGNLARFEREYCEHLDRRRVPRGVIEPTGKAAVMINDFPIYRDSSIVKTRAATEAGTLMKVASNSDKKSFYFNSKRASLVESKTGPTLRELEAQRIEELQKERANEMPFSPRTLAAIINTRIPLLRVLKYLAFMGMAPTSTDLLGLLYGDVSPKARSLGRALDTLLPKVHSGEVVIRIKKANEDEEPFDPEEFSQIREIVKGYAPHKSYLQEYVYGRPKTAHIAPTAINPNSISEQGRAVLRLKALTDPNIRRSISEAKKTAEILRALEREGVNIMDIDLSLLPVYDRYRLGSNVPRESLYDKVSMQDTKRYNAKQNLISRILAGE